MSDLCALSLTIGGRQMNMVNDAVEMRNVYPCTLGSSERRSLCSGKLENKFHRLFTRLCALFYIAKKWPCFNNGICHVVPGDADGKCLCNGGYDGTNCQLSECDANPCKEGAICEMLPETSENRERVCLCPTTSGKLIEIKL